MAGNQKRITVDTVADLATLRVGHDDIIELRGYTTVGDRGGSDSWLVYDAFSALPVDNGIVFAGPGGLGQYIRRYNGHVLPEWWDRSIGNDSVAITAAIAEADANNRSVQCSGEYICSDPLVLPVGMNIHGQSARETRITFAAGVSPAITINPNCVLERLRIVGQTAADGATGILWVNAAANVTMRDVFVFDFGVGMQLVHAWQSYVSNCNFFQCGIGVDMNNVFGQEINIITFASCEFADATIAGLRLTGTGASRINYFDGCVFQGSTIEILIDNVSRAFANTFTGCYFEHTANGTQIQISSASAEFNTFRGGAITDNGTIQIDDGIATRFDNMDLHADTVFQIAAAAERTEIINPNRLVFPFVDDSISTIVDYGTTKSIGGHIIDRPRFQNAAVGWYDAMAYESLAEATVPGRISSWAAVQGTDAVQTVAADEPLARWQRYNSPFVDFNTGTQHLDSTLLPTDTGAIFYVSQYVGGDGRTLGAFAFGGNRRCYLGVNAAGLVRAGIGDNEFFSTTNVGTEVYVAAVTWDGTDVRLFVNGVKEVDAPYPVVNGAISSINLPMYLGALNANGTANTTALLLGEAMVFDQVVLESEALAISAYLGKKWAVYSAPSVA